MTQKELAAFKRRHAWAQIKREAKEFLPLALVMLVASWLILKGAFALVMLLIFKQ